MCKYIGHNWPNPADEDHNEMKKTIQLQTHFLETRTRKVNSTIIICQSQITQHLQRISRQWLSFDLLIWWYTWWRYFLWRHINFNAKIIFFALRISGGWSNLFFVKKSFLNLGSSKTEASFKDSAMSNLSSLNKSMFFPNSRKQLYIIKL